jgi:cell wall-associated NlpC family hydrolase
MAIGPWKDVLALASKDQTLVRAQSALGLGTVYKLGKGGFDPTRPMMPNCDCSGFVSWAIGIPRELPPTSNKWVSTDSVWSGGKPVKPNLFSQIPLAESMAGDLLVYPDKAGHQGHIGIITQVDNNSPTYVIHCSKGNFIHYHDAIRTTGPGVFLAGNHQTRVMRINYDTLKTFL